MSSTDTRAAMQKFLVPLLVFGAGFAFAYMPDWQTGLMASLAVVALLLVVRVFLTAVARNEGVAPTSSMNKKAKP